MAQKKIGLSSSSPLKYLGLDQNTVPVSYFSRIPTSDDKNFPIGQLVVLRESPTTGSEGDVYCLSKMASGSASWVKLNAEEVAAPVPFAGSGVMNTLQDTIYYYGCLQIESDGNTSITNGTAAGSMVLAQLPVDQSFTCTELKMDITSFSATGDIHFGLYSSTDGVPGSLVVDFGTISPVGTGTQTLTFSSQEIPAGFYFLAWILDNDSGSAVFNYRTHRASNYYSGSLSSGDNTGTFRVIGNSYTSLPATIDVADLEMFSTRMKIGLSP